MQATSLLHRRRFIAAPAALATLALGLAGTATGAFAQQQPATSAGTFPSGPVTMVVGWPPGGPSDNVARLIAASMGHALGQPIIIDNRAGAGGNIGSAAAARAKPDGYTIMLATVSSHGLNSALYPKLPYDPIKDFAPVGLITHSPSVLLVPADSPFKTVGELLAAARANPGKLNYGSGGVGSSQHLVGASFKQVAGVDITHIPYKGTAPAMTDLMAGRVDLVITTGAVPFVSSGKVRALAVTSHERMAALPEVPTFEQAGVKLYTDSWYGIVAPAGTPRPVLEKLNQALAHAVSDKATQQQLMEQGTVPGKPMQLDPFWAFVKNQMPTAAALVKVSGATAE
ncbi:MAG: tripartite tricarboxylate transporter substrate binding protein [Pseudomonadota bacterium]